MLIKQDKDKAVLSIAGDRKDGLLSKPAQFEVSIEDLLDIDITKVITIKDGKTSFTLPAAELKDYL